VGWANAIPGGCKRSEMARSSHFSSASSALLEGALVSGELDDFTNRKKPDNIIISC